MWKWKEKHNKVVDFKNICKIWGPCGSQWLWILLCCGALCRLVRQEFRLLESLLPQRCRQYVSPKWWNEYSKKDVRLTIHWRGSPAPKGKWPCSLSHCTTTWPLTKPTRSCRDILPHLCKYNVTPFHNLPRSEKYLCGTCLTLCVVMRQPTIFQVTIGKNLSLYVHININ